MSDYRQPPAPDPSPSERHWNRYAGMGCGILIGVLFVSLAVLIHLALKPPTKEERAKIEPPRRIEPRRPRVRPKPVPPVDPGPAVPPPTEFKPPEVPMSAQRVSAQEREEATTVPAFTVGGTDFTEPEVPIVTSIDGKETITIQLPDKEVTVPVTELKLVAPKATQTKLGGCIGKHAVIQGNARTRNRVFYRPNPRVACAAFVAYCLRKCGRPGGSFVAHTLYNQLRKRGGKLVASRASTRYAPWYAHWRRGDVFFFWKSGNRIGHTEVCVGGGWTVGTSSSAGYVARRRVGNRGFARMSVVRL